MSQPDADWQRLDPRMLLVGPLGALKQLAVPAVIAVVGLSSSRGGFDLRIAALVLVGVVLAGVVPWLTTSYRVADGQFQRRGGLLNRTQVTAPLDRVRSVDLDSDLFHRLLGLTKVTVGTGVDETRIELDSLGREQAERLQSELLARTPGPAGPWPAPAVPPAAPGTSAVDQAGPPAPLPLPHPREDVVAALDWSWVRFAPLSLSRLVVLAGALGVLSQLGEDLPLPSEDDLERWWRRLAEVALPLLVLAGLVAATVGWLVVSVAGYVLQWAGMRLVRSGGGPADAAQAGGSTRTAGTPGTLRLTAGLLSTRSRSVETARVRGVQVTEPALMRLARGAELAALSTGVGSGGTSQLLPPSPLAENVRVGALLLGTPEPLVASLTRHGPRARRRAHVRQQWLTLGVGGAAVAAWWWLGWPGWFPWAVGAGALAANAALAEATYRQLGHALTPGHLVSRTGTLATRRTVLERDGIIGWVVTQSWFQRRAGLATLTATTAAGSERVSIRDVPHPTAVALAAAATPDAVAGLLVHPARGA